MSYELGFPLTFILSREGRGNPASRLTKSFSHIPPHLEGEGRMRGVVPTE
jgi:hypothetical protein